MFNWRNFVKTKQATFRSIRTFFRSGPKIRPKYTYYRIGGPNNAVIPKKRNYRTEAAAIMTGCTLLFGGSWYNLSPEVDIPGTPKKRKQMLPRSVQKYLGDLATSALMMSEMDDIISPDHLICRYISAIGDYLCEKNGLEKHYYVVIHSPEVNAFVIPGNTVFVYTGIIPLLHDSSGVAMLIGHEIGHILAGHTFNALAVGLLLFFTKFIAGSITSGLAEYLFVLPKSRKKEIEADTIGMHLVANACFDPLDARAALLRVITSDGSDISSVGQIADNLAEMMSTHPVAQKRIANLDSVLADPTLKRISGACHITKTRGYDFLSRVDVDTALPRISPGQYSDWWETKSGQKVRDPVRVKIF